MAKYRVLEPSFIDGLLIDKKMLDAVGSDGYIIEYTGEPSSNLEPVDPREAKKAAAEIQASDDALRAQAIKLKLTEDGKPGTKPIDGDTPIDTVKAILAATKQSFTN